MVRIILLVFAFVPLAAELRKVVESGNNDRGNVGCFISIRAINNFLAPSFLNNKQKPYRTSCILANNSACIPVLDFPSHHPMYQNPRDNRFQLTSSNLA